MIRDRRIYDFKTSRQRLDVLTPNNILTPDNIFQPFINVKKKYIKEAAWVLDLLPLLEIIKEKHTPNVHWRGRTNQIKCKLDYHTKPWRHMNIQFTPSPACPEAGIRNCSENKIFDQITNLISVKTEYRWS